ncbi:hypothetical protein CWE13_08820 [Aliidiomarina shirensis]|uniref:Restriction endonuclease n=1 Tax=Aliidiomarina shirensis TaxID=1048642 RepID=A0A432WT67_9GAMM|nr:hypothetical protein [Aliidiomarina shirensis]RUO36937.1 hypothetical protein CWE13_08820 [Aliidiomarina shirensis]
MKRVKRNPEKFEVIDLFTALGREHGYKLSVEEDANDFVERIGSSLKASRDNPNLLHGKRVESLFAHVAGGLGNCRLIKQEDSGEIFTDEQDIQAPDYKVILNNGSQYFIEVKNCHFPNIKSPYPFKKDYLRKIENYSDLHDTPLLFAIYFSRQNKWFLLRKESLIEQKNRYVTDFINAMAQNEMSLLGDRTIGTEPKLSIELLADRSQESNVNKKGEASFIIGDVKVYSSDREITDDLEKSVAFYLMRFGTWVESEAEGMFDDDGFLGARFSYEPELPPEEQIFSMIGELSSMISISYGEQTLYEKSVVALDTNLDPEVFAVEIPEGYKGKELPLWQFMMQPNPKFRG